MRFRYGNLRLGVAYTAKRSVISWEWLGTRPESYAIRATNGASFHKDSRS